jgi:hypothetical protein
MAEEKPELGEILARLERVERQYRRLKKIATVFSLLVTVTLVMGQARSDRTVEAERFVLKDSQGQKRADLVMLLDKPTLTLRDAKGLPLVALAGGDYSFLTLNRTGSKEQVTVSANKEFYGLILYDEKVQRAGLAVWNGIPGLTLYDEKGTERAGLDLKQSGPTLRLVDGESKAGFNMWVAPLGAGPDFSMYDATGQLRVDLVAPEGLPSLKLEDRNGYSAIFGSANLTTPSTGREERTSAASLTLFGKDKKVLWSAP